MIVPGLENPQGYTGGVGDMPVMPPTDDPFLAALAGDSEALSYEVGADGSLTIALDEAALGPPAEAMAHTANLALYIDEGELGKLAADLLEGVDADKESRAEWEQAYVDGLRLLGLKIERREQPWPDACGITHPVMTEAAIRFQARTITELFPATGPVKTRIIGRVTPEREAQAKRVETYMNYHVTTKDTGYFRDVDQMLFLLPICGQVFKKIWFDAGEAVVTSRSIRGEDVIHSYAHTVDKAPRVTHKLTYTHNEVKRLIRAGVYRDVDLPEPTVHDAEKSPITDERDDLEGRKPSALAKDATHTFYEIQVDLDLPRFEHRDPVSGEPSGMALPYLVTIDRDSMKVLSIRRNWKPTDPLFLKRQWIVGYNYLPGPGSYGLGLVHVIGGLVHGATTILRQLVDAGELANLQGGFKARGLRVADNELPLAPGEWRDVDAPGIDLTKALVPLPYRGPNEVLALLLDKIVDMAQRLSGTADEVVGDLPANAPVGSTLAAIEQALRPLTAVHKRLHAAQTEEFRLMADLIAENLPPEGYPYEVAGGDAFIIAQDFDARVDVIPVSDPNTTTRAQRIAKAQTIMQLALSGQQANVNHDMRAAYAEMYAAIGVDDVDKLMPPPPQPQSADPASENAMMLAGQPTQPAAGQDHFAHVISHVALLKIPGIGQSPAASAIIQHLFQTVALAARDFVGQQIGQPLPPPGQPLPPDVEAAIAQIGVQLTQRVTELIIDAMTTPPPTQPDPTAIEIERMRIEQRRWELQVRASTDSLRIGENSRQAEMEDERERDAVAARERMNEQDNAVALMISAAKGAGSAGRPRTDFNPNPGRAPAPRRN